MDRKKVMKLHEKGYEFYIYGAGKYAQSIYMYLKENEIIVCGFVVSDKKDNPDVLFGVPVIEADCFPRGQNRVVLVSITKNSVHYKAVFEELVKRKIHNVFFLTDDFMKEIQMELLGSELERAYKNKFADFFDKEIYYLGRNVPVESFHRILVMKGKDGQEYHWRMGRSMIERCMYNKISELFSEKTALEEFEEQYGNYFILHSLEKTDFVRKPSWAVYMAHSHADKMKTKGEFPEWTIPIQVGAALTNPSNWTGLCDNDGENISAKNEIYSECTALYWMWKHAPRTDYIGLCHYRRHFDISEEDFSRLGESEVDVLVTSPTLVPEGIESFFSTWVPYTDIEMLLKAIRQEYIEYLPTAQKFLNARFFPPCNLSVMKYDLFQEYMQFVFSITFKIEEFYNEMGFYRNDRYMGYLVECLLGIFLMHNKERLKIAYTDMIFYS